MTVLTHYTGNQLGLATLLVNLQPQLSPDDDIYIVDASKDRSGLKIASMYGSTRSYIFVEVGNYSLYEAGNFGVQSMKENKQDGLLFVSDRCLLPFTFIASLRRAIPDSKDAIVPHLQEVERMDPSFKWFSKPLKLEDGEPNDLCYYLKARVSEPMTITKLVNEYVIVLPEQKY